MGKFQYAVGISTAICIAVLVSLPPHKANPIWVRSAASLMIMHEIEGADLIGNDVSIELGSYDIAAVSLRLKQSSQVAENGYRAIREDVYDVRAVTRSRCDEFLPGCLNIERQNIFEKVSIKTDM